nr:Putative uncharacterized protein [Moritella viscosa]
MTGFEGVDELLLHPTVIAAEHSGIIIFASAEYLNCVVFFFTVSIPRLFIKLAKSSEIINYFCDDK